MIHKAKNKKELEILIDLKFKLIKGTKDEFRYTIRLGKVLEDLK